VDKNVQIAACRPQDHLLIPIQKILNLLVQAIFIFFGEFLYMQAKEDGLDYAISYSPCEQSC